MQFALNIILLSMLCHTSVWGQTERKDQASPQSLEWKRWIQGDLKLGGFELRADFRGSAYGDFNGDGWEDILMLTPTRVHVAWNGPDGLGMFQSCAAIEGEIQDGTWDGRALWISLSYPQRVECWSFTDRKMIREHIWDGRVKLLHPCPEGGVLVFRPNNPGLLQLQKTGSESTLIGDASSLGDAALLSRDLLLVQDDATGQLGMSRLSNSTWGKVRWIEGTEGTHAWDLLSRPSGQHWVIGRDAQNMWFRALSPTGDVIHAWRSPMNLRDFDCWLKPTQTQDMVEVVVRGIVTYDVYLITFDLERGDIRGRFNLEEIDGIPALLMPDLDRDGISDLIYPSEAAGRWSYATSWSNGTRRLFWRDATSKMDVGEQAFELSQAWLDALGPLDAVEELWTHNGTLLAKQEGKWHALEALAHPTPGYLAGQANEEMCHQLVVSYLDLGKLQDQDFYPALAEVEPEKWHHVVFQRSNTLDTEVWLDGQCVFQGKSDDADYIYNALLFGAQYGTSHVDFGALSLDRVMLSGRPWNEDEIKAEAEGEWLAADRYTTEWWGFDTNPIEGELTHRPADAQSQPKLTKGIQGKAVTFDGQDDALRAFVAVPSEHVTLSFHFRLNDVRATRNQAAVTLYGMHSTALGIRWDVRAHIGRSADPNAPLTTPVQVQATDLGLPPYTSLASAGENLRALDPAGGLWRPGVLGWERMPSALEQGGASGPKTMWFNDGELCLMAGEDVWIQSGEGWAEGSPFWDGPNAPRAVNTRQGTFFADSSSWVWCESSVDPVCFQAAEAISAPTSITWSPGGEVVRFGKNITSSWHPERRTVRLEPSEMGVHNASRTSWMWLALLAVSGALAAGLRWRKTHAPASMAMTWDDIPTNLSSTLRKMAANSTFQVDTLMFDQIIGQHEFESHESKRARRSRFIRECNQWSMLKFGVEAIHRTKDPQDRRRTLYGLHPEVESALKQIEENCGKAP